MNQPNSTIQTVFFFVTLPYSPDSADHLLRQAEKSLKMVCNASLTQITFIALSAAWDEIASALWLISIQFKIGENENLDD